MLMPSRRRQVSHPWLVDIPVEFHGKSYEDLAEACLENGLGYRVEQASPATGSSMHGGRGDKEPSQVGYEAVLPLGLYRMADYAQIRYVLTNPPKESRIQPDDQCYVLASVNWGHSYTYRSMTPSQRATSVEQGTLTPEPEARKPGREPSRLNLALDDPPKAVVVVADPDAAAGVISALFDRYDFDGSGSLNTLEELKMITTNVCFKLKLKPTAGLVESEVAALWQEMGANDCQEYPTMETFTKWFQGNQDKFR